MKNLQDLQEKFNVVLDNGHFAFIKFDGERELKRITVIIDFPPSMNKKMIKLEGDDLSVLLEEVLWKYSNVV